MYPLKLFRKYISLNSQNRKIIFFPMSASQDASVEYNQLNIKICDFFPLGAFGCFLTNPMLSVSVYFSLLPNPVISSFIFFLDIGALNLGHLGLLHVGNILLLIFDPKPQSK